MNGTSSAPRPPVTDAPRGKSALTRVLTRTAAAVKVSITDTLATLDNFVTIAGAPVIQSGRLSGSGVVLHRDEPATDNYMVTATIGAETNGKTWLVTCASEAMDSFYALEIQTGASLKQFHIIKGTKTPSTSTGLLGILTPVVTLVLGFFYGLVDDLLDIIRNATTGQSVEPGDTVGIWWDEPNSVVRVYKNSVEVTSLPVPRWEIPHGKGFRRFGVVQGIDPLGDGVEFTAIGAADV
ncbi:minor tail protein [Mycobacterium phage LilSpotty]|uniref:Minor tail protein n=1 Tax=Mycobacterium phage LilSpotty TaxID=2588512 RepID=A0A4Y6EWF4_9CAUD|nr:minor tail protein [Mycobacterium phage LilSpotty]QDF19754.1 minor tail protein [Mycobacterium phage LilSpotty]